LVVLVTGSPVREGTPTGNDEYHPTKWAINPLTIATVPMTRTFWSAFVATTVLAGLGTFGFTAHALQGLQHAMFWKPNVHVLLTHDDTVISVRSSVIRWANTFRVDVVGEDGYAMIDGRCGTYGNHTLRFGKRWAWADGRGLSQRASEEVFDLGTESRYLEEETRAVVEAWLTGEPERSFPHPASIAEALAVARLCEDTYALLRR